MFNTQQASPGEEFLRRVPEDLFAPTRSGGHPHRSASMPRTAVAGSPLVARTGEVTAWYRARRVWFAASLLLAAVTFRLAAAPEPASLQSAEIQRETPPAQP